MTEKNYLFTSESVSEGHPDKVCDHRIWSIVICLKTLSLESFVKL